MLLGGIQVHWGEMLLGGTHAYGVVRCYWEGYSYMGAVICYWEGYRPIGTQGVRCYWEGYRPMGW